MEFDYFYGQQSEQFSFYRIPKMLFTDDRFWNVSTDAKLLYGILLDRMNLSARNGWMDAAGRVYANQFKYQKVDGTPPGEELKKTTYSVEELGQRLGLKEATAYELIAKGHFEIVEALGKRRITKESFERWYASQSDYRTVEDQALDADIIAVTYGLPEIARMLGTHRQNIYDIASKGHFELIRVGRHNRVTKVSFDKWYQSQSRYRLVAEDGAERS